LELQYIKGLEEEEEEEESAGNNEGVILPQVRFIECPIKASLGVLGKKWTMLIIRHLLPQDCAFQSALRIYSWPYSTGTFNVPEGAREGGVDRLHRRKEIADCGGVDAYWKG
jgi:hypothetical protein